MDLRFVIHRAVTHGLAVALSLAPLGVLLGAAWRWSDTDSGYGDPTALTLAAIIGSLLAPPTRDFVLRLIDQYTFRTNANYQHTVLGTSEALTRVLNLRWILDLISRTVSHSVEPEGIAIYLSEEGRPNLAKTQIGFSGGTFKMPPDLPATVRNTLARRKTCLLTEEVAPEGSFDRIAQLHDELTRLNWALVLPLLSEDSVIGAIVVGPKLSGDPFYPHDIDLLMTLANQAGIAIKNAQLYTEVVLANEYIENIVATIESGVLAINAGGQVTRFNRAAAQLTGLAADDVIGRTVEALPEVLAGLVRATLADGRPRTEPEVALPDGATTRPVICTTSSLRDPAGGVLGAVAVFSDLTPLKELETERRRVERLAYFEILAASIAHEIKNPLVAIKTFAQLIPRRHRDEQFVDEFSRVVTREIGRMERLVERLRTLARSSDRPKQPLDLRGPVRDAVEFLRPALEEKRITVAVNLGDEARTVVGDHGELESLFLNLLMNAYEATPPDGSVAVDLAVGTDQFLVSVADSGPGIPPDLLEHVFDPFITTKPRGSGLGLSICAGIVAAHRAKLRAANRPGGGALLTVEFSIAVPIEASFAHEDRSARHGR